MAISITSIQDVQTGVGLAVRLINIAGVNATPGTAEAVAHGLPTTPVFVQVAANIYKENAYEAPTTYIEVIASRTDTNVYIASLGTQSGATGQIQCWYNTLGKVAGDQDAGEGVLTP